MHSSTTARATIVRHGQTSLNKENKVRAWIDVQLNDTGISEAYGLAAKIKASRRRWKGIITSDLKRATQTATAISDLTGIKVFKQTDALRPWDVGVWSGHDAGKVYKLIENYSRTEPDIRVGGGKSFNGFRMRVLSGVREFLTMGQIEDFIICTHLRCERLISAWAKQKCQASLMIDLDEFNKMGPNTASISHVTLRVA